MKALLVVLLGLLSATAVAQTPNGPEVDPNFPKLAPDANSYIVGPGDVLQVFVWRNPELSTSTPVLPDGRISTPLAEGITAVGKTPAQLARDIEKALAEYVRSPRVSVIVSAPLSTFSQIKLVGQFNKPQAIAFREGMRVLDAVLQAGGLGQYAAGNRAKIMRKVDGKDQEIKVKLASLVEKGDLKQNILLQPGDILVVPETLF